MPSCANTINLALRRMGFDSKTMTAHGFRAMASTLLNEQGHWNPDAIERQLGHAETDDVRRAYEVKDRKLVPVPDEAERVRNIMRRYLEIRSVPVLIDAARISRDCCGSLGSARG
jgi:integrase